MKNYDNFLKKIKKLKLYIIKFDKHIKLKFKFYFYNYVIEKKDY